ncbi:MAG TPA: Tex family protein [Armatimonadota bacterium]|nr:Tex family protein [Armatimonadota bacterium]
MTERHSLIIARELGVAPHQVSSTAALLSEGATVPFIARYRKEVTGALDEVAIAAIRDRLGQLEELDKRRAAIIKSLDERGLLTSELRAQVDAAPSMAVLEDIYLPYRPKRRTRATVARERGLEPLALALLEQTEAMDPLREAATFIDEDKGVASAEEALAGARDIIAERVSEDQQARSNMRRLYATQSNISSRVARDRADEGAKYRDYFEWTEPIANAPSHRILAMMRGENEGFLRLTVAPPEDAAIRQLRAQFVTGQNPASEQVALAVEDGYKRLLAPSMETEIRGELKRRADEQAIRVFASNVRELLLTAPLGQKRVVAIDPGLRTGCKLVCLDEQGKLVHHDVFYIHDSGPQAAKAGPKLRDIVERFRPAAIAIGNGTASRETEAFVRGLGLPDSVAVVVVNESGASVYSASEVAREEFPDQDVTVRGAVSIGRRLMDPLAELVKIDPKSIGVGQYQHDVDQAALRRALDDVVVSCVNAVGVDVNTASKQLLTYVSGLGPQLAQNIVNHRNENGPFRSREQLMAVPRLGPKAFEQAAGFLRVRGGDNPLDASAVHPESYHIVNAMARDAGCTVADLLSQESMRARIDLSRYVSGPVGMPTLHDIIAELAKPGRDPRQVFEAFAYADGVVKIEDVRPGMVLPGIVTNVTAFGAFVDVGVHQDGLVHVSQLADRFVRDPNHVVRVGQRVRVRVLEVDLARRRISLSMRSGTISTAPSPALPKDRGRRRSEPRREQPQPVPEPQPTNWFTEALRKAEEQKRGRGE